MSKYSSKSHRFEALCAWEPDWTGYVIDYGAWPDQKRNYFTRRDIRTRLSAVYTGDESGMMHGALTELGERLAGSTASPACLAASSAAMNCLSSARTALMALELPVNSSAWTKPSRRRAFSSRNRSLSRLTSTRYT